MAWAAMIGEFVKAGANTLAGISAFQRGKGQAKTLEKLGNAAYRQRLREKSALLGRQRVAFAKGGVDIGTGTPLDLMADTAGQEQLAANTIKAEYERAQKEALLNAYAALHSGFALGAGQAASGVGQATSYFGRSGGTQGPQTSSGTTISGGYSNFRRAVR